MATPDTLLLEALFHHLVLPPKVPRKFDGDNAALNLSFVERLQDALALLRGVGDPQVWQTVEASLQATKSLNQGPQYRDDILNALQFVKARDANVWLGFYVTLQNAALIVRYDLATDRAIVEGFSTAAPVADVLKAEHALTWDFPGRAVAVPLGDFSNESFLGNLTLFLEQASSQSFDRFAARACKGGQSIAETRDCPSSALIDEILMSLLEGLGSPVQTRRLRKRVRDDVLLDESEIPWRRSPYWLVLRVTLHRILSTLLDDTLDGMGRVYYKFVICAVLANLLKDCMTKLHPEMTLMLQAKLCRRLAKLESEKASVSEPLSAIYHDLFIASSDHFRAIIADAKQYVADLWEKHKSSVVRQIPILPHRAPEANLRLQLTNSGSALLRLLSQDLSSPDRLMSVDLSSLREGTVFQVDQLATKYSSLVDCEAKIVDDTAPHSSLSSEFRCKQLAASIEHFLHEVGDAYADNSLLMSRYLLRLFELWMHMDEEATAICPLLKDFHPTFVPSSLNVLCLQTVQEMERLSQVQRYMESRVSSHTTNHETIFGNPRGLNLFPARFLYSTGPREQMTILAENIDALSQELGSRKQSELADLMQQYNKLTQEMQSLTCTCTRFPDGSVNIKGCLKCYKKRSQYRLSINAHEDLLPSSKAGSEKAQRAAILLELRMPSYLAAYRAAVWKLHMLGSQVRSISRDAPELLLKDLQLLDKFPAALGSITLASRKKSFLQTHYKKMKLPKKAAKVIFPFGAEFSYYDSSSQLWADQLPKIPWFQHLLGSWLPKSILDPYALAEHVLPDKAYHPSSYEIIANESKCPPNLSVHEFSAFQRAVAGRGRRWLVLLIELDTTNFNYSSEATMKLFNRLALQAGPAIRERGALREAHIFFNDQPFCARLHEQLQKRLGALVSSWRETHYMTVLVTLSLRLYNLCPQQFRSKAEALLSSIRSITSGWITQLRNEIRSTHDGEVARKASTSAFWAALLCRQTFWVYESEDDISSDNDAQPFFRASIALQENLLVNVDELHPVLKHLLIVDLSDSYAKRDIVKKWFRAHQASLECSINETWANSSGLGRRSYSPWKMLSGSHAWWATSRVAGTRWTASQTVHYHLLQGHLIVDGKPLGRLPLQMRQDPAIQELFGEQHLLTRPSSLLEYQLVCDIDRHQIHFGFRDGRVVIRAFFQRSLLEYVPRTIFKDDAVWDLPAGLVDDCVHWLNLQTGHLEIRRKPWIWKPKRSNWILDVRNRVAIRNQNRDIRYGKESRGTNLIEPRSEIGQCIANIFRGFEDVDKLTVYQPVGKGSLSVEMKRLEIRFSVNSKGLLECPQLRAEVDPQQDAGTLYGLSSQIVLRNVLNPERRIVLVPIGIIRWQRQGIHVNVRVANHGIYASFGINELLGRLDCPPEPLLLYLKAAVHALTSFPLPDGLTRRTGTEEARHCLLAARSQPWSPLKDSSQQMLSVIRCLSPERWYYPPEMKLYQKVKWDDHLTMSIQHEEFAVLVDSIRLQSQNLEVFDEGSSSDCQIDSQADTFDRLYRRGRTRRQLYERICFPSDAEALRRSLQSFLYDPGENSQANKENHQVYQTARALSVVSDDIPKLQGLSSLLEEWADIGGFEDAILAVNIETLLSTELSQLWGSLVRACSRSGQLQNYDAHFLLALLASDTKDNTKVVQWLVALYRNSVLRNVEAPQHTYFSNFCIFEKPSDDSIQSLILAKQPLYADFFLGGRKKRVRNKIKMTPDRYEELQMDEASRMASCIMKVWPLPPRSADELAHLVMHLKLEHIHLSKAWEMLESELQRLLYNFDLSTYLSLLEGTALRLYQRQSTGQKARQEEIWNLKPEPLKNIAVARFQGTYSLPHLRSGLMLSAFDLYSSSDEEPNATQQRNVRGATNTHVSWCDGDSPKSSSAIPSNLSTLESVIKRFASSSNSTIRNQYSDDLQMSFSALVEARASSSRRPRETARAGNVTYQTTLARRALREFEGRILASLSDGVTGFTWLDEGSLWPCVSRSAILEQLRDANSAEVGPGMKAGLVRYGILITELQRLLRMHSAALYGDERRLREDEELQSHLNWKPIDHPEWLLLEIDNNLLIRPSQIDVARAIISPSSASNSVLQMNMGQGKTSCILPMAIAALADTTRLCRLIVPRPLLLQTAQVIQDRIGGLVGRVVRHIPFSRRSPMHIDAINKFQSMHEEIRSLGGVMLCLPEHVMSFKLSGLQQLVDGEPKRAQRMMEIQRWLERSCRDVLDESDFTLSPKTQLIYPSGTPMMLDGHPQRWKVVEELLLLVENHVPHLRSKFSDGFEIVRRHHGYPILHFLRAEAEEALSELLIDDICKGRLPQLKFKRTAYSSAQRDVGLIVSGTDVDPHTWQRAAESLTDDIFGLKSLYLLRGLISQRLLLTCLKKRWNVQYGLHPQRAPIAVPFEAKGVPSPTAEYGHPDTSLVLTCLAFYQTGLTKSQVTQCLQHVLRSDDPPTQYERLVYGCKLPTRLEHWNLLNTDDDFQVEELWEYLRLDTTVLNYFLNNFAFPAHAKQFGVKLQTSGWDIPLLSSDEASENLTTGFSGTNDNKRMLPQTIRQDDLPSLVQTNAEVLSYLLEPRNQRCYQAIDKNGRHLTERGLLELLRQEQMRVLIDAGAHVLEMSNDQLAVAWLDIYHDAQGAVYFDSNSRIMVRARFQKAPVPLLASPFAENLEQCVVYIDEAHTRGTDLKLPVHARGAVTLGLGQTKDHTVQAAMRLRQLGSTQSVAFIVPPEVYRNVLDLRPDDDRSCRANENMMSLHTAQGLDFCQRTNALWKHRNSINRPGDRLQLLDAIQQREDRTLEQLYGPRQSASSNEAVDLLEFDRLKLFTSTLCQQKLNLSKDHPSAFEEVELQREVEFEFEQVREKQKPMNFTALKFPGLAPALAHFATTGHLKEEGENFVQGFDFLSRTRLGRKFGVQKTQSRLFVSKEFTRSITGNFSKKGQDAIRPVEWVLWSRKTETALIIIPEEVELLLPTLRDSGKTGVCLLTYAAPVAKSMRRFNALTYFTMPSPDKSQSFPKWLSIEIGVIAGRLYFDYSEYPSLIAWLGIGHETVSAIDLPSRPSQDTVSVTRGLIVEQPLNFLLEWLTHRRQTMDIMHTPMGYVCQGRDLHSGHSFFTSATASRAADEACHHARNDTMNINTRRATGGSDDDSDWGLTDEEELSPPESGQLIEDRKVTNERNHPITG
ncbi:hypothetical protein FSARC_8814 [Fusarium sarcochroum]|uniref:ubiquitinyl hydrolase 1 n=1 Tax=Fusarium sarcochroum TaxID=1208366 RepID=A0A8H4TSM9_9HYPO|nr:hypothetical protein FSARC_8814 [Fusarium sarcochroum]